jgi:hemolysin activation/secretion protein
VLRGVAEYASSTRDQVLAGRLTVSRGMPWFDATSNSGSTADGEFTAGLAQVQFARRLSGRLQGLQLVMRGDLQIASSALLSLEDFALGGMRTVRGYHVNELVRDNGWATSLEVQIPILQTWFPGEALRLAPFVDVGQSWNHGHTEGMRTLSSVGGGLIYGGPRGLSFEIYSALRLRDRPRRGSDLQSHSIDFNVRWSY